MSRKVRPVLLPMTILRKNGINILAIALAVPTLWYSLSVSTPRQYVQSAGTMLAAAANMSAAVPANPDNTVAAALAQRGAELDQREAALAAQNSSRKLSFGEILGVGSFFISLLLLILVALNFYYDAQRGRLATIPRKFQVDLR